MSTTTIVQTKYDYLTGRGAAQIMQHCVELGVTLGADDFAWLTMGKPATLADAVQYVIDKLNDEHAPHGHWYYMTADNNLALDVVDEDGGE